MWTCLFCAVTGLWGQTLSKHSPFNRSNPSYLYNVMYLLALYYSGERSGIEMHVWPIKVPCVTTQRLPHGRKNPGLNWIETGRVCKWFAAALNWISCLSRDLSWEERDQNHVIWLIVCDYYGKSNCRLSTYYVMKWIMQIYLIYLNNKSLKWKILSPLPPPKKKIPHASNEGRSMSIPWSVCCLNILNSYDYSWPCLHFALGTYVLVYAYILVYKPVFERCTRISHVQKVLTSSNH